MGGQMQQSNAAATALYDHPVNGAPPPPETLSWLGGFNMQGYSIWPLHWPPTGSIIALLPNLLMQGYGVQSAEEKQRLFKLMRNLNFNGELGSEPYSPTAKSSGGFASSDGLYSPEFRGDFGAGLLDLHSMDDTELLSEHVISEPFEPSPFMPAVTNSIDNDYEMITGQQQKGKMDADAQAGFLGSEKDSSTRENNVAKIKVVVHTPNVFFVPLNLCVLCGKKGWIVHKDGAMVGRNSISYICSGGSLWGHLFGLSSSWI